MRKIHLTPNRTALIDDSDFDLVSAYRWTYLKQKWGGYACTVVKGKTIYMHRLILNAPKGILVDHANHDGLDNRRENIRLCSHAQNNQNKRVGSLNSTGYKGVSFHKAFKKFYAHIQVNRKLIQLGYFDDAETASEAYNNAAQKHFGSFATLNA